MGVRLRVWPAAPHSISRCPRPLGAVLSILLAGGSRKGSPTARCLGQRTKEKRVGGRSLRSEAGSGPCPTAGAQPTAPSSAWPPRLRPRTCPQMSGELPRVRPTRVGLSSLGSGPRHPPSGTRVCGERARNRRGRARRLTPGQPRIGASAGPGPPLPPARPRCSGSCHLPRPPRHLSPPQPGRARMGATEGSRRADTHHARRRRRRARLPAPRSAST
ncbi:PANO1 isoform 1 [Pongo abelii]|uniref:PANO1 isoform 1 n=1 Tax=Pongo abelii TaxID=9601 RepID=A0A2J8XS91_PONAB|nr:PANO1 isoform 1 [Pongo abelii]